MLWFVRERTAKGGSAGAGVRDHGAPAGDRLRAAPGAFWGDASERDSSCEHAAAAARHSSRL